MGIPQVEQVCFEKAAFVEFLNLLYEKHSAESLSWLVEMGKAYGKSLVSKFSQYIMLASELKREEQMEIHMKTINRLGWGKYSFKKIDWSKPMFEIELTNNIFIDNCKTGNETVCYFLRGVLAGALEGITDSSLEIDMRECVHAGGEGCVFVIRPAE